MNIYFNLFKVKFAKLYELINKHSLINNNDKGVNVFINLEEIIIKLCNPKVDEYLRVANENKHIELISEILNLASHYRLFFTKNGIKSNIYLYMQYPFTGVQKNIVFNKDYRKYYSYKFNNDISYFALSEALKSAIPLTKIVLEYVEGVYFIQCENIENSLVPKVISEHTKSDYVNFIVTSNIYDYQYVNHGYNIIISKQDKSEILTKDNVIDYICDINEINDKVNISSKMIPFILSIIGSKYRNIYNIKGFGIKKTFKLLEKALSEGLITPNIDNINILLSVIKSGYRDIILMNYYCSDISFQYDQLNAKDIHDITSQLVDKFDNVSLKKLNDKFFENSPINLIELTSTVVEKTTKPKVTFN